MQRILLLYILLFSSILCFAQDTTQAGKLAGMSLEDLMSVKVVSASGRAQTVQEAPSTIRVITSQQIEDRGYEKLADVLRDLEGVDVIHVGGYMPNIFYFRGMYGAENLRTLLLIDGIRENNLVGSAELAGPAYPLHNVERIEIIWGPAAAIYGADAFGGVMNIITKKGAEMSGLHYEKEYGTFNTSAERASFGMSRRNIDVAFSGSLYSTDGPRYTNRDPYYHGSYVDNAWSFNGTITHTYKKFKTTLGTRFYDTPMSWGLLLNSATKTLNLPSQGHNSGSGSIGVIYRDIRDEAPNLEEIFSRTAYLKENYSATDKLKLEVAVIYRETGISDRSYVYLSIDTPIISPAALPGFDTSYALRLPVLNYSNRIRYDMTGNYTIGENQNILAGVQVIQENLEPANRRSFIDTAKYIVDGVRIMNLQPRMRPRLYTIRNSFGSYAQYELHTSLLNSTSFTAGIRYDFNDDYNSPLSPRLGIVIHPERTITAKLLYGTAFRTPTPTELTANKAPNPEQVSTYEINFIYQPSTAWLVQLNGFHNDLKDIFVLNSLTGGSFQQRQLSGTASISGVELRMDMVLSPKFSDFFNFTYQHGVQEDATTHETFNIPDLPELKGNAGLTYHMADYLTVTAIGNWVGNRKLPHSNPYGADKDYVMDGYFIGNLVLTTRKFYSNRVSASVNVENLFNNEYLDPGIRTADGILYSTVLEQPGRILLFKISVNL
jgi:outer membrane receptor for ferrienterochelin and colicins